MTVDDYSCLNQDLLMEEFEVLQSIYPDCVVSQDFKPGDILNLEIPVEFGQSRPVLVVKSREIVNGTSRTVTDGSSGSQVAFTVLELAHLPSILLTIALPPEYPSTTPPSIISLQSTHAWLSKTSEIRKALLSTWAEGEGVLCQWVEFIQSGDFLNEIGLVDPDDTIRIPHTAPEHISSLLTTHDTISASASFAQNSFSCSICMESLKGARCILLTCSHVFCRPCLEDFWGLCIKEGDVGRVGCADPACVKAGREASEEEVRRVVSEEQVQRWKWLRMKRAVEKDPTIVHCPIQGCQAPVLKPPRATGQPESGWDRLRTCDSCGFSFCAFCARTWHGPLSPCPISFTMNIVLDYLSLAEDSPRRSVLEKRYGKGVIQKLVKQYQEEESNKAWLETSTTPCPGCKVHVEKNTGCNHMTCVKCGHHFCYRCGEELNGANPYTHFSMLHTPCYGKLFDYVSIDDQWQPMEAFEALQ